MKNYYENNTISEKEYLCNHIKAVSRMTAESDDEIEDIADELVRTRKDLINVINLRNILTEIIDYKGTEHEEEENSNRCIER